MNPSKSESLKIGLAGMIGCLLALMFAWHWSESLFVRALAIPTGFLAGWIAYAPISFFAAFLRAWRRVVSYRPPAGAKVTILVGLAMMFLLANWGTIALAAMGSPVLLLESRMGERASLDFGWMLLAGPALGLIGLSIFTMMALLGEPMDQDRIEREMKDVKRIWELGRKFNLLTIPFFWLPWCLFQILIRVPSATMAIVRAVVIFAGFLIILPLRLIRAWAELTASNGRLTSGLAAALGTGICLWQDWPPVPGCLTGFAAGVALWGLAVLALRCLPAPRPIAAVA